MPVFICMAHRNSSTPETVIGCIKGKLMKKALKSINLTVETIPNSGNTASEGDDLDLTSIEPFLYVNDTN